MSVRINGLDTHWCYRDIVDVVEHAGRQLDTIVIAKVSGAGDVHLVATLLIRMAENLLAKLEQIEVRQGLHAWEPGEPSAPAAVLVP